MAIPVLTCSRPRAGATLALSLVGLIGVGWLAYRAWMEKPLPDALPTAAADVAKPSGPPPPFLLAVVDGMNEDGASDGPDPAMPFLVALGREGTKGIALAGEPTLTAGCVRTLLTGRNPDIVAAVKNFTPDPVEGDIVGFLAARGARAAHGGDANIVQMTGRHYRPEDVKAFEDEGPKDQGRSDDLSVPFVLGRIEDGADLVTLHLVRPDHAAHKFGATGPEYRESCRLSDVHLKHVVEAFRRRHPDATVLIAADHGVTPRGTHGGGEPGARRAPFVLVGPHIARAVGAEIEQSALAPTVAAALSLPQPPLAESPPEVSLTTLSDAAKAEALDAYLKARIAVATRLGWDGAAQMVESKRAKIWVDKGKAAKTAELASLYRELSSLAFSGTGVGPGLLALLVAAAWLAMLVRFVNGGPLLVAPDRSGATDLALAGLAALPIVGGAALAIQDAFDAKHDWEPAAIRLGVAATVLALAVLVLLARRSARAGWSGLAGRHPALVAALGGGAIGFTLTLRPFIEPLLPGHNATPMVFAAIALAAVFALVVSPAARERVPRARWVLLGLAGLLFGGSRVVEWFGGQDWTSSTAGRLDAWECVTGGVAALLLVDGARRPRSRLGVASLALSAVGLVAAFAARHGGPDASWNVALAVCGGTILLASFDPDADRRLASRLLAALTLCRLLESSSGATAVFAVLVLACRVAGSFPSPRTRLAVAGLAVLLLAARISTFHAMGHMESTSTFDVGAIVAPVSKAADLVKAEVGGGGASSGAVGGWTGEQIRNVALLFLRFAAPWLALLAAAARSFDRDRALSKGGLRALVVDLSIGFAARGAAISAAMWVWWSSSWWMRLACPVFAMAAGDVLLIAVALALTGGFRSARGAAPPTPA